MSILGSIFDPGNFTGSGDSSTVTGGLERSLVDPAGGLVQTSTGLKNQVAPGSSSGPSTASDIYAALTREQWENYVTTFVPIENQLIQYATNDQQPLIEGQAAGQRVLDQFGQAGANDQRRLQSLGVTLSPQEAAASARQTDNDRALATVQGQNLAMDLTRQRQQSILGNPAPATGTIAAQASGLQI